MTDGTSIGLFETIYSTRALRRLRPDPVPDEVLFQAFDAAIRAPSGSNAQDWRFVVIREPAVKAAIGGWFQEAWQRYQPEYAADPSKLGALPRHRRLPLRSTAYLAEHVAEAPVIVAPCGVRGKHSTPGGSIFPAVQNLLLAARALGLGGSITNFAKPYHAELMALLGIPEEYEIHCLIPLGYPLDRPGPLRRRPVKQAVFMDRWEQSWPFAEAQPAEGWGERWLGLARFIAPSQQEWHCERVLRTRPDSLHWDCLVLRALPAGVSAVVV